MIANEILYSTVRYTFTQLNPFLDKSLHLLLCLPLHDTAITAVSRMSLVAAAAARMIMLLLVMTQPETILISISLRLNDDHRCPVRLFGAMVIISSLLLLLLQE